MSRHPFAAGLVAAATVASGVVFISGSAHAAGPSHGGQGSPAAGAPKAFKTFTSPAGTSIRVQKAATAAPHAAAASGTIIYSDPASDCLTDTGNGTSGNPYCILQDAVNAATAGDTIDVAGSGGSHSGRPVTVKTSNISIVGIGDQAWIWPTNSSVGNYSNQPALVLDDVTGVTISNLMLTASNNSALEIIGSSNVTVDSSYVNGSLSTTGASGLTIDGASSGITVSHTYVDSGGWFAGVSAISVASGASKITLAGDITGASGVTATDVAGLDVVGSTIQRGCSSGIDVEGTSTGVTLENNLIEDANPSTDGQLGGYNAQCVAKGLTWAPDVTVAAASSGATTADYNDFYVYGSDATTLYSGVGRGAHDTVDTKQPVPAVLRLNEPADIDAGLVTGSLAIGSANAGAPGEPTSDFYGTSPYTSRGAVQYLSQNPSLAASLTAEQTSAYGMSLTANVTSSVANLYMTTNWGDGTTYTNQPTATTTADTLTDTVTHSYTKLGTYTVTVTVQDSKGDAVANEVQVVTDGNEYTAYGPVRVLDTRAGTGTGGATTPVPSGGTIRLQIDGNGGIPADTAAVALNLTVTDETANGYITAYPDGIPLPTVSNVNFVAGQTVANMTVVTVGSDGYIDLHNTGAGTVHLVADAGGYFEPINNADGYTSFGPVRFLDTRSGTGGYPYTTVSSAHPVKLQITGQHGVPSGVTAVAVNLTVANPSSGGYITAYPDGSTKPTASNANFQGGQVLANAAIVPVGSDGSIDLAFTGNGSTRLVADVYGYYSAGGKSLYTPVYPFRGFDTRANGLGAIPGGSYDWIGVAEDQTGNDIPSITGAVTNTTVTDTTSNGYLVVFPDGSNKGRQSPTVPNTSTLNFLPRQTVANLTFAVPASNGAVDYWNSSGGGLQLVVDVFGFFETS